MDGIAAVQARIQEIQSRAGLLPSGGRLGSTQPPADTTPATFAEALAQMQNSQATENVPTSSGKLNKAGVDPVQWARDFLTKIGMPVTSENVRAVTAWEQAEGTAAKFNPLATTQGGFPGSTKFNSVGVRNFASYQDGIDANAKVINNGLYANILAALRAGNDAHAVARAIEKSPWGTGGLVVRILSDQDR